MTEEEAYWTFSCIIENLLPLDYYQHMLGARVDQKIIDELFKERFPRLNDHFDECGYMASNLVL